MKISQIRRNMMISIFVQCISLIVSFLMNLILPKYIDEYQYAYWQTYLLYIGYVGVLHFGLLDGIVLRYSQYDYEELDKPRLRSQFKLLLFINTFFTLVGVWGTFIYSSNEMKSVFALVAVGILTRNIFTYTSYSLQITNRIDKYATMIISYRIFYGIVVCVLLVCGVKNFYWFCLADLCSDAFGIGVGALFNKGLYFGKSIPLLDAYDEFKENISAGFMLMVANWSSFLLTGSARLIIQWHWNELVFGKISFAFSITNLFLTFVSAISVVLFPSLKRTEAEKLPMLYREIREGISPFLTGALLLYFPGCIILNKWLPDYSQSLEYLGILLPIIVFASKVSLLTNNYLKAYRKEKLMLAINLISVIFAVVLFGIGAYILNNLQILLICIVVAIMFRSIISEIKIMKIIKYDAYRGCIIECLMSIIFMYITINFDLCEGFILYLLVEIAYIFFSGNHIKK